MTKPAEKHKDVEILGRNFRVKKFDARTGSFMIIKVTGILGPLFKQVDLNALKKADKVEDVDLNSFNIPGILEGLGKLSEEDFSYVQDSCLKVCGEMLPAGYTPVLNSNGTYGVSDLEDDTVTVMALTAHALMFNAKSFLQGNPLASLVGGLLTSRQ